jgi:hypothetical protein
MGLSAKPPTTLFGKKQPNSAKPGSQSATHFVEMAMEG